MRQTALLILPMHTWSAMRTSQIQFAVKKKDLKFDLRNALMKNSLFIKTLFSLCRTLWYEVASDTSLKLAYVSPHCTMQ